MKTVIAIIATVSGGLMMVSGPATAQNEWGSIAVGNTAYGESITYGFAWNYDMKEGAIEAALNGCRASGGTDCVEETWVQNGCIALTVDQYGNFGANAGMTPDAAEARAVRDCEANGGTGCVLAASECVTWERAGTGTGSAPILAAAEVPAETAQSPTESLTREQRIEVQRGLSVLGFDPGPADGLFGPKTRAAIWDWQEAKGLEATGYLTHEQTDALGAISAESELARAEVSDERESEPSESQNTVLHFPRCDDVMTQYKHERETFGDASLEDYMTPGDLGCWQEATNQADCNILLPVRVYLEVRSRPFTWSGSCQHNAAHGEGMLEFPDRRSSNRVEASLSGEFVDGRMQGYWRGEGINDWTSSTHFDETGFVGSYVDSIEHGRWRLYGGSEDEREFIYEGPYVDGKRHGHWIEKRNGFGRAGSYGEWWTEEGPYVDGKRHGHWHYSSESGRVTREGPFVDGLEEGTWILRERGTDKGVYVLVLDYSRGKLLRQSWHYE